MREALEMAKKKVGLNLPPGDRKPEDKPKDPVQELEDQVAQEQDFDKRQGLLLQLRELRLQREIRVRDLEERLKRGGGKVDGDGDKQETAEREKTALAERERLMGQAKALLDSGLAPQQVGQMLLGLPLTAAPAGVPAQGMSVSDALKLVDTIIEKRTEGELRGLIVQLDKKIDRIAAGGGAGTTGTSTPQSPIAYAKEQAQATKAWMDALKELGVPVGEAARGSTGESIESLKEKHRHEEKMEEISVDRTYKESIATALGDVVERVGRGAAHQFMEEGGPEEPAGGGEIDYFTCPEKGCRARIFIPPDATQLTCPKCNSVYARKPKEK